MANRIRSTNLVLLPGMMCDARIWRPQEAVLRDECRVWHGDICQHQDVAALAARVLANSPASFALAGLSMGGIVAMEMWRQAPERIERLALIDTNFRADTAERRTMRDRQIVEAQRGSLRRVLKDEMKPNYLATCHRSNHGLLDEILAMGIHLGSDVFVRQSRALRDRPDSRATLATISCPTLVLCGAEDSLCSPDLHREMAGMIPRAALAILRDCGHLATLEQPRAVTAAMRTWLRD